MLLFGAEVWVVTPRLGRVLGVFQDQVAQQLAGNIPRQRSYRSWEYILTEEARYESGFDPMETYTQRR